MLRFLRGNNLGKGLLVLFLEVDAQVAFFRLVFLKKLSLLDVKFT
jgi:hypothetical protein